MVTAGLVASLHWLAFGGVPVDPPATDRFEPRLQRDLVGFQDFDFDSGWFPMDSPVQLRLYAHAADSIEIEMLGDGRYDWDAETIAFAGDPMGGRFAIDVGLQLEASVRFDVAGIQWESDILGPWDYAVMSEAYYTPYLLPGNPEAPVEIADQTDGVDVASVPIVPDIIVASGNLDVSVAADVTASLAGVRIEATTIDDAAIVDAEGVPSPLTPSLGADPMPVDGVLVASLQTAPVLIVRPHLTMSILGQDFEIFGIDIPIALPVTDEELVFDPEPLLFDAPEPPPSSGVDESGSGGDEGATSTDGPGSTDDDATSGTDTDTDTDGAAGFGEDLDGCGCRQASPGSPVLLTIGWLVLARRRRRCLASPH